jgi:hypothetical protein
MIIRGHIQCNNEIIFKVIRKIHVMQRYDIFVCCTISYDATRIMNNFGKQGF